MGSLDVTLSPLVGILAIICFVMYLLDEADNYKKPPDIKKGKPSRD